MQLYNYVAGGPFPPSMPEGFNEWKFGHADVVIFALAGTDDTYYYAHHLASHLQTDREFRGLVYSFSPENRDYLKCADFFRVSAFPSYVVVLYSVFRELLCTGPAMSHRYDEYNLFQRGSRDDESWHHSTYHSAFVEHGKKLDYIIINGDALGRNSSVDIEKYLLDIAHRFCIGEIRETENPILSFDSIPSSEVENLHHNAYPLRHDTEITVLFTRPAWRHTKFERLLYDAFIRFGSITDDVLVRILYPSYISDEYAKHVAEYKLIKLPAAIFKLGSTGQVVVKVERDFFEYISDLSERIEYIISDIHRAIASGDIEIAKMLVKELQTSSKSQPLDIEETTTVNGKTLIQLRSENFYVIQKMEGDIVAGNKVQDSAISGKIMENTKQELAAFGLSHELYRSCRSTLLKCSEFDSDTLLRTVFVTTELQSFQSRLPEATSKKERVAMCLDFLLSTRHSNGCPLLSLFLTTLRDRYLEGDALRNELEALNIEVEQALDIQA